MPFRETPTGYRYVRPSWLAAHEPKPLLNAGVYKADVPDGQGSILINNVDAPELKRYRVWLEEIEEDA